MSWPVLVPSRLCRTPIRLVVYTGHLDEDGAPETAFEAALSCNWQDGGGVERTAEQQYVRVSGRAYFPGDICPELPEIISGFAEVFGERRRIVRGVKARNPDGTVNYTEVRFT